MFSFSRFFVTFTFTIIRFNSFIASQDVSSQYYNDVRKSAEDAHKTLNLRHIVSTEGRLALMISFSHSISFPLSQFIRRRFHYLHCSLWKLYNHLGAHTPIDVFLWVSKDVTASILPLWLFEEFPSLIILPIPASSWIIPKDLDSFDTWKHRDQFSADYHLNARWRLTFAMDFVYEMKYSYVLFADDDLFMMDSIDFNIIESFTENQIFMAVRGRYIIESSPYVLGLPEFTRYWMTIRNYTTPVGDLFNHITPPLVEGLTTASWDKIVYPGCFFMINVEFYFSPLVSDYRKHIIRSGSDMELRWTEQAVWNMMLLLFVPPSQLYIFPTSKYQMHHIKPEIDLLPQIGCPMLEDNVNDVEVRGEMQKMDAKIREIIFFDSSFPRESADFYWSCKEYESVIEVPCEVDLYASLPVYIESFCSAHFIENCDILGSAIFSLLNSGYNVPIPNPF